MSGPGQIDAKRSDQSAGADDHSKAEINLSNFEIDRVDVKPELRKYVEDVVVPTLKKNGAAGVTLVGSADRQGTSERNNQLADQRADAIKKILNDNGIAAQIVASRGAGAPATGPMDNPTDRGVRILLAAPLKIESITLYTDDWSRPLKWDDVIGLKGEDGKAVERFNVEVKVSGAPRPFMREQLPLQLPVGHKPGDILFVSQWLLSIAANSIQGSDANVTTYRDSGTPDKFSLIDRNADKLGLAIINRESVPIDLGLDPNTFVDRGVAAVSVPGSEAEGRIDAKRLLLAGGVERFVLRGPDKILVKWFVRRPATIFVFSNNGTRAGYLSTVGDPWASPKEVHEAWKDQKTMQALILAAPFVLDMNIVDGAFAMGGPGAEWAQLLRSKNGPLAAILGYDDFAPEIGSVGTDIAKRLGKQMSKGLIKDGAALVDAWLSINAEHDGKDTWNAVGMDKRGYKWIVARSAWSRSFDRFPFISGDKYRIVGPAPIL